MCFVSSFLLQLAFHNVEAPPPSKSARRLESEYWTITSGSEYCHVSSDGKCITDGPGPYGSNELCTATANRDMTLHVSDYQFENWRRTDSIKITRGDAIVVQNPQLTRYGNPDYYDDYGELQCTNILAGDVLTYQSDEEYQFRGFTLCALNPGATCTPAPTNSHPRLTNNGGAGADLELLLPGGVKADFRGRDGSTYCFLSTSNLAVNGRMSHIEFERFHPDINDFFKVDGSFMTAMYVVASLQHGHIVRIAYDPGESFKTGCTVSDFENGQPSITALSPNGANSWGKANITVSFDAKLPKLRISTSDWSVVVRAMSIRGAGKRKRLDLVLTPRGRDPFQDAVAPHGLLGQAWDGDSIAVEGKTDNALFAEAMTRMGLLGKVEKVKTAANAEGAIEGVESDYIVSSADGDSFSTKFTFSRFGLSSAAPRNASQLSGLKKLATSHSAGVNGFMAGVEA